MNKSEFVKLYCRVQRAHYAVHELSSKGYVRDYRMPNGSVTRHEIVGIKSPENIEDDLLNLFIWIWSMKDYLKTLCGLRNVPSMRIEQIANADRSLTIVSDIANRAKHGTLTSSRSGDYAKLQNVTVTIPMSALQTIAFLKPAIKVTVELPENAELSAEIGFDSGIPTIDAFVTTEKAIDAWRKHAFPLAGINTADVA